MTTTPTGDGGASALARYEQWYMDNRKFEPQTTDEVCPECGAQLVALRQPSNVRGCKNCQDMYKIDYTLRTVRKVAMMEPIGD